MCTSTLRAKVESSKSRKEGNPCGTTLMNRMKDERYSAGKPKENRDREAKGFRYTEVVAQSVS